MHELFQSVLKHHLQVKIQAQPPLFPWETELTDYPDYSDTSSMMWTRNEKCSIKELFKFRSLHPKQTFKTSPSIYQNFIGFYVLLTIKLASKLEILLLKNTCNTEVIHSFVMKTLHWLVSSGKYFLLLLLLVVLPASSLNYPSISAPRVYLTYLNKEISISLKDLERVIQINRTHKDWRFFLHILSYNQLQKLQRILISPIYLDNPSQLL